jgi:hypothetical protein
VGQPRCLLTYRLYPFGIGVAERDNGDTAGEIQIAVSFRVEQISAFAMGKNQLRPGVGLDDVLLF